MLKYCQLRFKKITSALLRRTLQEIRIICSLFLTLPSPRLLLVLGLPMSGTCPGISFGVINLSLQTNTEWNPTYDHAGRSHSLEDSWTECRAPAAVARPADGVEDVCREFGQNASSSPPGGRSGHRDTALPTHNAPSDTSQLITQGHIMISTP